MTNLFVSAPHHWQPLTDALSQTHNVFSLMGGRPSASWERQHHDIFTRAFQLSNALAGEADAFTFDLQKSVRAVLDPENADALAEVTQKIEQLPQQIGMVTALRSTLHQLHAQHTLHGVVVTCTWDVAGRAIARTCRDLDIPLIHVQHGSPSPDPRDSWWAREFHGNVICVGGRSDQDWWKIAAPDAQVIVTGNPLWDRYAGMDRYVRPPTPMADWKRQQLKKRTVLWIAESGASPAQTHAVWESRVDPHVWWDAFLGATKRIELPLRLIIKIRAGEDEAVVNTWVKSLNATYKLVADEKNTPDARFRVFTATKPEPLREIVLTDWPPEHVLPLADLVIGQGSNMQTEAALLGIPCINLQRDGYTIFKDQPRVTHLLRVAPPVGALRIAIEQLLSAAVSTSTVNGMATDYNRGRDGKGMERTLATINLVVKNGVRAVMEAMR